MLLFLVSGCSSEEPTPDQTGTDFFPLKVGWYQTYFVKEKRYAVASDPVESSYFLKVTITDSIRDTPDGIVWVMERRRRESPESSWESLDTWSARRDGNSVVVSEGNTPFVKLQFPLVQGQKWNGNAFNTLGEDEYILREVRRPLELNGTRFENTVTAEAEFNLDPIVFRDERKEIYAKDVGLVYREIVQHNYCTTDACLGHQKIDEGFEMYMTITEYGRL